MGQSPMREKLAEARYFRAGMDRNANDLTPFKCELSAFLTAARTVLQYLRDECGNAGRQGWYDNKMADQMFRFMGCQRNVNIHERPIEPRQNVTSTVEERVVLRDSFSITTTDEHGNVVQHEEIETTLPEAVPTEIERTVEYRFADWTGQEDVPALCDKYVGALESILDAWDQVQTGVAGTKGT